MRRWSLGSLAFAASLLAVACDEPRVRVYPIGGAWANATTNLAGIPSECGNLSLLSVKPDQDLLIASVAQHGLWSSTNGGVSWAPMGQGAGSAVITNRASSIVYDPTSPRRFWESGLYNGAGVYRTDDDGDTFLQLGSVSQNDLVSIDFTDPQRQTLLAGAHERPSALFRSTDGGGTWTDLGSTLPAEWGNSTFPLVVDGRTHLLATWATADSGIFRTIDGAKSWSKVFSGGVFSYPMVASDGTIYWLLEGNAGLIASGDSGVTWKRLGGAGIFAAAASLIELPDGRLVSYRTGFLVLSSDRGATWTAITPALPFVPNGVVYSRFQKALYIWHWDCAAAYPGDPVLTDAIMRLPFDYTRQ